MQHKKKVTVKKSADIASPKASTCKRKVYTNKHAQAMEAKDLITSSVRKQKFSRSLPKNNKGDVHATNLNATFGLVKDDASTARFDHDGTIECDNNSANIKGCDDNPVHEAVGTLFSPSFQSSRRTLGGEIANGDFLKYFHHGDQLFQDPGNNTMLDGNVREEGNFNEDDNLAWKECVDEYDKEHLSADGCIDEEEIEELEFDPYFFIKNLPDLLSVVPAYRPVLLPKQTRSCPSTTLVLDLDETLVHSTLEPCQDADFTFPVDFNMKDHSVFVRCRPYLREFMDRVCGLFEVIIFTASQSIYAEQLLNILDPKRKVFRHRVYRESCIFVNGNYLKDLTVLGRDLAHVVIIDNSPQVFGFQIDNGIPIESWFDDRSDNELVSLLPFLESLVAVEDVRPLIAEKFNLHKKIAEADNPIRTTIW